MRLLANSAHSLLLSLSSGYILFYFSELIFWEHPRPEDTLSNWTVTWLAYLLMAFLFLALVLYTGLRIHRRQASQASVFETMARSLPLANLLSLLLIPLTAGVLYAGYWFSGLKLPTNWAVYLITTPAGFGLLGWSLWKAWSGKPAAPPVTPTAPGGIPPQTD